MGNKIFFENKLNYNFQYVGMMHKFFLFKYDFFPGSGSGPEEIIDPDFSERLDPKPSYISTKRTSTNVALAEV